MRLLHGMALRSPLLSVDATDLSTDSDLASRFHVRAVPDITVEGKGGSRHAAGHAMEPVLLAMLLFASGTEKPET